MILHSGGPPGADPGNWIALSKELAGNHVRAAAVTYPPLVPSVVLILSLFIPSITSVSILGVAALASIGAVSYFASRSSVSGYWAAPFAVASIFLGYNIEVWSFGGYPQLLCTTLFLGCLFFAIKWLLTRNNRFMWFCLACSTAAVATSSIAIPLIAIGLPVVLITAMRHAGLAFKDTLRRAIILGGLVIVGSLPLLPWYIETARLTGGHIWNPIGNSWHTISQSFAYAFSDWSIVFSQAILLIPLALILIFYGFCSRQKHPVLPSLMVGVLVSSLVVFMLTYEIRILAIFQIGLLFGMCLLLHDVYQKLREYPSAKFFKAGVIALALVVAAAIVIQGNQRYFEDSRWYQVVNHEVVNALDFLKLEEGKGIVVAQANAQGNPYSWWIEGYSGHPAYTSSDPRWLSFTEEREQNAVAVSLFAAQGEDIRTIVDKYDIRYLFIDKTAPACDPRKFIDNGFGVCFENSQILILKNDG